MAPASGSSVSPFSTETDWATQFEWVCWSNALFRRRDLTATGHRDGCVGECQAGVQFRTGRVVPAAPIPVPSLPDDLVCFHLLLDHQHLPEPPLSGRLIACLSRLSAVVFSLCYSVRVIQLVTGWQLCFGSPFRLRIEFKLDFQSSTLQFTSSESIHFPMNLCLRNQLLFIVVEIEIFQFCV